VRKLYFLLPGTTGQFACGGLWAELKTFNLAKHICPAEIVTYRQREKDRIFLDDLLKDPGLSDIKNKIIFVMSWGFDVAKLADRLRGYPVIYHAHSAGYGFHIPAHIPIITVSRNTMGYWGQKAPHNLIYYLPNQIGDEFKNFNCDRDIDVLVQARKSSDYLLDRLVPALQKQCHVFVVNSYIEDLPGLFNRAKIYLYDSAQYWALQRVSEGFGLQPLEAIACGCYVFSSINGGLSDYLDPGFNSYKIAGYSPDYDIQRILRVLEKPDPNLFDESLLAEYRTDNILNRLRVILEEINEFFDSRHQWSSTIPELTRWRMMKLWGRGIVDKLRKKLSR